MQDDEEDLFQKAMALRGYIENQIMEWRKEITKEMHLKGLSEKEWVLVDNAEDVLLDPMVKYQYHVEPRWQHINKQ